MQSKRCSSSAASASSPCRPRRSRRRRRRRSARRSPRAGRRRPRPPAAASRRARGSSDAPNAVVEASLRRPASRGRRPRPRERRAAPSLVAGDRCAPGCGASPGSRFRRSSTVQPSMYRQLDVEHDRVGLVARAPAPAPRRRACATTPLKPLRARSSSTVRANVGVVLDDQHDPVARLDRRRGRPATVARQQRRGSSRLAELDGRRAAGDPACARGALELAPRTATSRRRSARPA